MQGWGLTGLTRENLGFYKHGAGKREKTTDDTLREHPCRSANNELLPLPFAPVTATTCPALITTSSILTRAPPREYSTP